MRRRTALRAVAALSVTVPTAGCGTLSELTAPAGPPEVADGPGDYPHEITVDNERAEPATVTITVEYDEDGSVLYDEEHTIPAETRQVVVAGFPQRNVRDGQSGVTVVATLPDDTSDAVDFAVDDCHGSVYVTLGTEEPLQMVYSIC